MIRRRFITLITCVIVAAGRVETQPAGKKYRVGYLSAYPVSPKGDFRAVFVPALRNLGYVDGDNLVLEVRSASDRAERLPTLAAELVRAGVEVIVTGGDSELRAAREATGVIPIVMAPSGDPVGAGYVASLARPGGNITGLSWQSPELSVKLLQVLKEAVPKVSRVAVLWNAANPVKVLDYNEARRGAKTLGLAIDSIEMRVAGDLDSAFTTIARTHPDALLVLVDELLNGLLWDRIADFALKQRLPSVIGQDLYPAAGGLLAYAPSMVEVMDRAARYVDKILKGVKPADLPVEQPTRFRLIVNTKTAKALGLTIPQSLLLRADQVIE